MGLGFDCVLFWCCSPHTPLPLLSPFPVVLQHSPFELFTHMFSSLSLCVLCVMFWICVCVDLCVVVILIFGVWEHVFLDVCAGRRASHQGGQTQEVIGFDLFGV